MKNLVIATAAAAALSIIPTHADTLNQTQENPSALPTQTDSTDTTPTSAIDCSPCAAMNESLCNPCSTDSLYDNSNDPCNPCNPCASDNPCSADSCNPCSPD